MPSTPPRLSSAPGPSPFCRRKSCEAKSLRESDAAMNDLGAALCLVNIPETSCLCNAVEIPPDSPCCMFSGWDWWSKTYLSIPI